jgi:hypothetical protein
MKTSFVRKTLVTAALTALCGAASAASFQFSYVYEPLQYAAYPPAYTDNTQQISLTGSFEGSRNGNLISDISNVLLSVNNVPLFGGNPVFVSSFQNVTYACDPLSYQPSCADDPSGSYTEAGWVAGNATLSFDGLQNNFSFADLPGGFANSFAFYHLLASPSFDTDFVYVTKSTTVNNLNLVYRAADISNWSVTEISPVPIPGAHLLFLTGLAAMTSLRKLRPGTLKPA